MAGKVTDFDAVTAPSDDDVFYIVQTSDGTDKKITLSSLISLLGGKVLGELFYLDQYEAPSVTFPALSLSTIDGYTDISSTNWSSLVTRFRAQKLYYERGKSGETSAFAVSGWSIASNVATLTFTDTTAENAILGSMLEDEAFNGSYSNWRTITLATAIGDITAGDYSITEIDTTTRTVKFAFTAANNSGSGTYTVEFYPHRIAGSTTTARVFEADGLVLATAGASGTIAGLRTRDQMQGHKTGQRFPLTSTGSPVPAVSGTGEGAVVSGRSVALASATLESNKQVYTDGNFYDDGTNGTPRTGTTTRERRLGAHLYIWARDYAA